MTNNRVTITMIDGTTKEVHPDTPVKGGNGVIECAYAAADGYPVTTVYEPTREHWTPYQPWMRDLLADDARTSALFTLHDGESRVAWQDCPDDDAWFVRRDLRIHPYDTPERPAEEHPDEALAQTIADAFYEGDSYDAARAAREHIYAEPAQEWVARDIREAEARAVQAEAKRDEWKARYKALRADVEETVRDDFNGEPVWDMEAILDRDDERGQAQAEVYEWKARYKALRADVEGRCRNVPRWADPVVILTYILERDSERGQAQDGPAPDTVTLRRYDVESLLHCWGGEPDFNDADRAITARVRAALGRGDDSE